jgi:3-deoxy-D-manno-octulosonate 8-phosphate phosphatase (KDO 8-P phosphatase)
LVFLDELSFLDGCADAGLPREAVAGRGDDFFRGGCVARYDAAGDKLAAAEGLRTSLSLSWAQIAVIGDDWPDLPLFQRAGFACAVANAHTEVKAAAHHVTTLPGGRGAAREFCDLLLVAAGRYASLLQWQHGSLDVR